MSEEETESLINNKTTSLFVGNVSQPFRWNEVDKIYVSKLDN